MTNPVETLDSTQIAQAQNQASAIANTVTSSVVGSNTFVFFAAFDGTENGDDPALDGSGDTQTTAVNELYKQVFQNQISGGSFSANYYPGVGTPSTYFGSSFEPNAVTAQSIATAQLAYDNFATQAYTWLQSHPGGSVTSMITSFSRGGASAAIFAQMLYENGLVYTDPTTGNETMLIPPGQAGAISAALIVDPVLTGELGNMDFPPTVQHLTVVQAQNEYRSLFPAANYNDPNAIVLPVMGNHGDAGDLYDNGLGGIYLQAYTQFFSNAGLNIASVPTSRQYTSGIPVVIHSEVGVAAYDYSTYNPSNDLSVARQTSSSGLNGSWSAATTMPNGQGTEFTSQNGDLVLGGAGGSIAQNGSASGEGPNIKNTLKDIVVLPDAQVTVSGFNDSIIVNDGATLNFQSSLPNVNNTNIITLNDDATLNIAGTGAVVNVDDPEAVTINKATNVTTKYTVHIEDNNHNDLNYDPASATLNTDANGNVILTAQSSNGTPETITVDDTNDNDTVNAGGIATTVSSLGYISYDSNGNIVLNQASDTELSGSNNVVVTSTIDGTTTTETINAASINDLTTDTLNFEGQSIAGTIGASGDTDQYGRTYTLDSATNTLTITGATSSDSLTISNFQQGDFGVTVYSYVPINVPDASATTAVAINDAGQIVGNDSSGSFVDTNGTFTVLNLPGPFGGVTGINNAGQIVGSYQSADGQQTGFLDNNGAFSDINVPGATETIPSGINNSGQIVGNFVPDNSFLPQGFVESNGVFTAIDVSGARITQVDGINDAGQVVGTYVDSSLTKHGFLYSGGAFTTIDFPAALDPDSGAVTIGTELTGINNAGEIIGTFATKDANNNITGTHNFLYSGGVFTLLAGTEANGINNTGQIAGSSDTGAFLASAVQSQDDTNQTLTVADGADSLIYGNGNTITAGNNDTITVDGNNNTAAAGTGGNILLDGSNNTLTAANGDTVTVTGNGQVTATAQVDTVNLSSGTVETDDATLLSLNGTGNAVTLADDDSINLTGSNNTLTVGTGDNLSLSGANTVNGAGGADLTADTITFNGQNMAGDITLDATNTSGAYALSGSALTVTSGSDTLTLNGFENGDYGINISYDDAINGSTQTILASSSATVTGNNNTLSVAGNDALTVSGDGNTVNISGSNSTISLTGAGESVNDSSSGNTIGIVGDGTTDANTIGASNDALTFGDSITATLSGSSNTVTGGANDTVSITGNNNAATAGSGSNVSINGSGDTITAAAGDTVNVSGNGQTTDASLVDAVNASNDTINIADSTSVNINGSGNTIVDANDNVILNGNNNTLTVGSNDIVSVTGSGNTILAASGADLTTSTISFDGDAVSGSQTTNNVDQYGNSYALDSNNNLTVTGSNGDTLVINNFVNGDFGLNVSSASATTYNESNGTLSLGDNADAIVNGDGNFITAGTDSNVTENGSWGWVTVGTGSTVTANGDGNTLTVADGGIANLAGQYNAVHVNNGTVNVTAASDFNLDGNGDTLNSSSNVSLSVLGNNDNLTLSGNTNILTIGGTNDAVDLSATGLTVASASSSLLSNGTESITLPNGLVNVDAGDSVTVTGTDGTLTASNAVNSSSDVTNTINWNAGGSQVQTFSNLSSGVSEEVQNYTGANGTGTLTSTTLYGTSGNDTLTATGTNQTLVGNGGNDTYQFGTGDGADTIVNGLPNTGPSGELDLSTGISTNQIWFQQIGNNLQMDILGTQDSMTVAGWYGSDNSAQLSEIKTADGYMIDTQLAQLVQAMATFGADNPAFNPVTATQMPSDPTLQSTLAAAWHH